LVLLLEKFLNIRAGKASPAMLGDVLLILRFGNRFHKCVKKSVFRTPRTTCGATMLHLIEKAIMIANIGFNNE
jgi:ribosome recycling factor